MRLRRVTPVICICLLLLGFYEISTIMRQLETGEEEIGRIRIFDRFGNIIAIIPKPQGYGLTYTGSYDPRLISSIIAVEDRRFSKHMGVDIIGKIAAFRDNIRDGTLRGGSTITEQYIKNTYFRDAPRTIIQKLRESTWAMILETKMSKDEILRRYLDTVYMGNTLYGVGTALSIYFSDEKGERLSDDTILEIITRLRYPNLGGQSLAYRERLREKLQIGSVTSSIPGRERPSQKNLFPFITDRILSERRSYCAGRPSELDHFVLDTIPADLCTSRDIVIRSSIDLGATEHALEAIESVLTPLESKNVHNGAILALDASTQKILVYVGNRKQSKQNAIDMVRARRSVGSTLKPFLYLMALHSGIDPDDLILDTEKIYKTENAQVSYISENYNPKPYGPVTLRAALGNSLNNAAVRLTEHIGVNHVALGLRSLGFSVESGGYYGYGIMLGAIELSLEEVVKGYISLTDLSDVENFIIYDILSDNRNRSMTFGISSVLNTSIPLAVKTGTSTDFRDNWTVGYDGSLIVGVWVGNADRSSMDDVSGVTGAGPIYRMVAEELIVRGYSMRGALGIPGGLSQSPLCLDIDCIRREIQIVREGYSRESRPLGNLFKYADFATALSEKEKKEWNIQ